VDAAILELVPDFGEKDLKLVGLPVQGPREQAHCDALVAFAIVDELISANLLQFLVLWPCVDWYLVKGLPDIDEAGRLEPGLEFGVQRHILAVLEGRPAQHVSEDEMILVFVDGAIVGGETGIQLLYLKVAARLEVPGPCEPPGGRGSFAFWGARQT
jgi:hypothetical protein